MAALTAVLTALQRAVLTADQLAVRWDRVIRHFLLLLRSFCNLWEESWDETDANSVVY